MTYCESQGWERPAVMVSAAIRSKGYGALFVGPHFPSCLCGLENARHHGIPVAEEVIPSIGAGTIKIETFAPSDILCATHYLSGSDCLTQGAYHMGI